MISSQTTYFVFQYTALLHYNAEDPETEYIQPFLKITSRGEETVMDTGL